MNSFLLLTETQESEMERVCPNVFPPSFEGDTILYTETQTRFISYLRFA